MVLLYINLVMMVVVYASSVPQLAPHRMPEILFIMFCLVLQKCRGIQQISTKTNRMHPVAVPGCCVCVVV